MPPTIRGSANPAAIAWRLVATGSVIGAVVFLGVTANHLCAQAELDNNPGFKPRFTHETVDRTYTDPDGAQHAVVEAGFYNGGRQGGDFSPVFIDRLGELQVRLVSGDCRSQSETEIDLTCHLPPGNDLVGIEPQIVVTVDLPIVDGITNGLGVCMARANDGYATDCYGVGSVSPSPDRPAAGLALIARLNGPARESVLDRPSLVPRDTAIAMTGTRSYVGSTAGLIKAADPTRLIVHNGRFVPATCNRQQGRHAATSGLSARSL